MMNWIMKRFGASVEELANEAYEELMGFDPIDPEAAASIGKGHKPPRHDIQKLKELADFHARAYGDGQHWDDPDAGAKVESARHQWESMTMLDGNERTADRVYREVQELLADPDATGFLEGDEDPFQVTVDVLSGKQRYWPQILDFAERNMYTAELTPESEPLFSPEEARKLVASMLQKKKIGDAPRLYNAIRHSLVNLRGDYPESYKLWPWLIKQLKSQAGEGQRALYAGSLAHLVDVVGNAGKIIADERRQNRLPQNFDISKMDFADLEKWYMDWKQANRKSEAQGDVVYEWDDGWTMQRLTEPEQLQYEGDEMGHCVGDYGHHVDSGRSIIYSLRDPKGEPHVTIELEGAQILKQLHDKPMSEFDGDDVHQLELGKKMMKGQAYPTPLFENGQDHLDYANYTGMGKENRWPNYLTERDYVSPHNVDENSKYFNQQGVPWDKTFFVVQVQGNSNTTPKPEYQARVKEFLDYLKSKGFKFERSADWYPPHDAQDDERLDGYEDYTTWADRTNRYGFNDYHDDGLGWYEHYRAYPEVYGAGDGEDEYGIKRDRKYSGFSPGIVQDTLEHVIEQGEDPDYAAQAMLHWAMSEHMAYADMDRAVREASNWMQDQANEEHERAWETGDGTWIYTNPDTGEDEEVEDYDNIPEEAYWNTNEDPKYSDGYKFINALDQYLAWYYNNKKQADSDRHPSMALPKLQWIGDNIPDGFREGTDPYAPSPEEQTKADAAAQQDAFSTTDFNGVFSSWHLAGEDSDPDYVFVYYMSELRVEPWEVNIRYENIFEQLLREFHVDLGNSALDIDPTDVAAGEIRIKKKRPVVEHKQLCPPEIREQAEASVKQWWAKQ